MSNYGSYEVHFYTEPPDSEGRRGEMDDEATRHFPLNKEVEARAAFAAATQDPKWS